VIVDQQTSDDDDDQFVVEAALPLPEMPEMERVCSCCKLENLFPYFVCNLLK